MNRLPTPHEITLAEANRHLQRMPVHEFAARVNALWPDTIRERADGSLQAYRRGERATAAHTASA